MAKKELKEYPQDETDKKKREILFEICQTKQHLWKWIYTYLDLDMPDTIVDPESDCSPMDMIWEVYDKCIKNNDPYFNRVLYYSSRDSFKTLSAAILEVLCLFHLNRDAAHMAALEGQSRKCQSYVKKFLSKKVLRDFKVGDNLEEVFILRYYNKKTGINLTEKEWKRLTPIEQDNYEEIKRYIKIVIATLAGANSEHVPFFLVDEVDVVRDRNAYGEAKLIPASRDGLLPVTVLTSTRKFSFGLVQKEIEDAVDQDGDTKLHIRHWNVIDITEKCPASRHKPELPKLPIYVDDINLRAISEEKYEDLNDEDKKRYIKNEGFDGCLTNCKLFAACKGRLATNQRERTPKSVYKPINETINKFKDVTISQAQAQLLCHKPSEEGLIYPALERGTHIKTASQMAEMLLGYDPGMNFNKKNLIDLIKTRDDWGVYCGMDFGFTHPFACVTALCDGYRCFVIDMILEHNLLPDRVVEICTSRIKRLNPLIWGDMENPQMIATLKAAGFRMKKWEKGPGSLKAGIDDVRLKIRQPFGEPTLFFLAGDPWVELLFKNLCGYHYRIRPDGELQDDDPDEENDDGPDAIRYLIMNKFGKNKSAGRVHVTKGSDEPYVLPNPETWTKDNMFQKILEQNGIISDTPSGFNGAEPGLKWSM